MTLLCSLWLIVPLIVFAPFGLLLVVVVGRDLVAAARSSDELEEDASR